MLTGFDRGLRMLLERKRETLGQIAMGNSRMDKTRKGSETGRPKRN